MKGMTIFAIAIIGIGIYMAYTKDSSFTTSLDFGPLAIGAGAGILLAEMV
jgi:hypothetical protein